MRSVGRACLGLAVLGLAIGFGAEAEARALFAYPLQGQSPQQQDADRLACHQWAVQQTGYDPSGLPIIVKPGMRGGVVTGLIVDNPNGTTSQTVATGVAPGGAPMGLIGGVVGKGEMAQLNALYAQYLAAGATCLTARGYQVTMPNGM